MRELRVASRWCAQGALSIRISISISIDMEIEIHLDLDLGTGTQIGRYIYHTRTSLERRHFVLALRVEYAERKNTTRADIFFFDSLLKGEEPPDTGGGRVFSLDAALGLLATRRRLGRRGDSSPCAQLLWCELYVMKSTHKKEKNGILLILSLSCEYMNLAYIRVHVIYRVY